MASVFRFLEDTFSDESEQEDDNGDEDDDDEEAKLTGAENDE